MASVSTSAAPGRRPTWGGEGAAAAVGGGGGGRGGGTGSSDSGPRRWRCVKATQSKLEPGNAFGNRNGRRVESGETLAEVSRESRSTLMGMVSQDWVEFLDPITQTMAWVPLTGLASDRRFVELPRGVLADDSVDALLKSAASASEAHSGDSAGSGSADDRDGFAKSGAGGRSTAGSAGAGGGSGGGGRGRGGGGGGGGGAVAATAAHSAGVGPSEALSLRDDRSHWHRMQRIEGGGGGFCDAALPLVRSLLNAPLVTLASDQWRLERRRRRARRVAAKAAARLEAEEMKSAQEAAEQAARQVARRISLGRSNRAGTTSSVFSVEEGTLEAFLDTESRETIASKANHGQSIVCSDAVCAMEGSVEEGEGASDSGSDHENSDSDSTTSVGSPSVQSSLRGRQPTAEDLEIAAAVANEVMVELERRHSGRWPALESLEHLQEQRSEAADGNTGEVQDQESGRSLSDIPADVGPITVGTRVVVVQANNQPFCAGTVSSLPSPPSSSVVGQADTPVMALVLLEWNLANGRPAMLYSPLGNLRKAHALTDPTSTQTSSEGTHVAPIAVDSTPKLPSIDLQERIAENTHPATLVQALAPAVSDGPPLPASVDYSGLESRFSDHESVDFTDNGDSDASGSFDSDAGSSENSLLSEDDVPNGEHAAEDRHGSSSDSSENDFSCK